tara:strand:- start:551 stop:898 length:348 start_codon:yes stop_codon:yes gene_type:complete
MLRTFRFIFFISLLIIFYLSLLPASEIPNFAMLSEISDKVIHAIIYFYLGYLGLNCAFKISENLLIFYIFNFGLIIEIIHFFHSYRYFEFLDLLANLIGVTIALLIFKLKSNLSY